MLIGTVDNRYSACRYSSIGIVIVCGRLMCCDYS